MKNRLIALLTLCGAAFSQAPAPDVCRDFTAWYQAHSNVSNPPGAYRAELMGRGLSAAAADQRLAELFRNALHCPQVAALNFDRLYSGEEAPFFGRPNAFLVECTRGVKPGRALDVAMGQGRNALYLAKSGWQVTGFDVSSKGLAAATAAAERAGVKVQTVLQGWQDFDFGTEKWDLIVLSYAWVPISDPVFATRLVTGLRPGGLLVFEHFVADKSGGAPGGPAQNELLRIFGNDLRIRRYEDTEAASDWTAESKARVARLLATK